MTTNRHNKTPSAILGSSLMLPAHMKRDSFAPMPSKNSDILEPSARNNFTNRPQEGHRYQNSQLSVTNTDPMTYGSPYDDSSPPDVKLKRMLLGQNKASPLAQKFSKNENIADLSTHNRNVGQWHAEEENIKKQPVINRPKSYTRLWQESKSSRDALRNLSGNRPLNVEQGKAKENSYLRQHQKKLIRKESAACVIQRWFRQHLKKRQRRNVFVNQGMRQGIMVSKVPKNFESIDSRKGKTGQYKGGYKQENSGSYEYEELEGGKETSNFGYKIDESQNQVLEQMYRQMQANIMNRLDSKNNLSKRSHQDNDRSSFSTRDLERNAEDYSSRAQSFQSGPRSGDGKQIQFGRFNEKKSPGKSVSWERSTREHFFTSRDYDKAAVVIQKAMREYLGRRKRNRRLGYGNRTSSGRNLRSGGRMDTQSGCSSKERNNDQRMNEELEDLSNELRQANSEIGSLREENERLKVEIDLTKENMEQVIEERLENEKVQFKDMLNEYGQFIDKLLQEKVNITQYCEAMTTNNKELKAQISKYEAEDNRSELQERINELENQNRSLQANYERISDEVRGLRQERKELCSIESVRPIQEANEALKNRNQDLESRLAQAMEKISKYSEVSEINQILLQKLQYAGDHINNIEEKLHASEAQYKALEHEYMKNMNKAIAHQPESLANFGGSQCQETKSSDYSEEILHFETSQAKKVSPLKSGQSTVTQQGVQTQENQRNPPQSLPEVCHHKPTEADFSFEVKGSMAFEQDPRCVESFRVDDEMLQKEMLSSRVLESGRIRHQDLMNEENEKMTYQEEKEHEEDYAHPFDLRKCSKDYVSGKFAQNEESSCIQENTLDEEQNQEINQLIQNISRKLEFAKTKMEERPLERVDETEMEDMISYRDLGVQKTVSAKETVLSPERGLTQESKNRAKSTVNLHKEGFVVEEEQGKQESPGGKKSERKGPGDMKRGIMDTLKKAELLFGRGNLS